MPELKPLAALLDRRRADIEHRWTTRARHNGATLPAAMPAYLDALAQALTLDGEPDAEARAWGRAAREHALTRVREGFDVDQIVHELSLLRQVLLEVAREEPLPPDQGGLVNDIERVVDVPIAAAVHSYVDARDYQTRRSEAEHISFMTHELRNPLATATLAAAQLGELGLPSQTHERALELIRRSLGRLRRLIDSGLDAELLQLASQESRPVYVHLGGVLEESLRGIRGSAIDRGVELELDYEPALRVWLDPLLTATALHSLFDNVIRFSDGGRLLVRAVDTPQALQIEVWDSSERLSDEELGALFEPSRSRGETTRRMDLVAARRALEAQGGSIRADSDSDGCRFHITLPKGHK